MTPIDYHPDWLLPTPPRNPYLVKSDYAMVSNVVDKLLYKFFVISQGEEHFDFHRFTTREEGQNVIEARQHIKQIQEELDKTKKLANEKDDIKKLN